MALTSSNRRWDLSGLPSVFLVVLVLTACSCRVESKPGASSHSNLERRLLKLIAREYEWNGKEWVWNGAGGKGGDNSVDDKEGSATGYDSEDAYVDKMGDYVYYDYDDEDATAGSGHGYLRELLGRRQSGEPSSEAYRSKRETGINALENLTKKRNRHN